MDASIANEPKRDGAKTIIILGAGLGGLACARRLSELLPPPSSSSSPPHRILVIDKSDAHNVCATRSLIVAQQCSVEQVVRARPPLLPHGVEWLQAEVIRITESSHGGDDGGKAGVEVVTDKGSFQGDQVVVALGADYNMVP